MTIETTTATGTEVAEEVTSSEGAKVFSRKEMRDKIFGAKPKSEIVEDFFGVPLELRQPTLEVALSQRDSSEENKLYFMLTEYAYVPGTPERVFGREDIENLKQLPFGPEFSQLMDKVNKLLGVDPAQVEAAIKDAEKSS